MGSQHRTGVRRSRLIASVVSILSMITLSACSPEAGRGWLPSDRDTTSNTGMIMDLWVNSWIAALVVGAITWGLILWCIIAYRRRKGTVGYPRQLSYHLPLEIFYLAVPLIMVIVLFAFTDRVETAVTQRAQNPDVVVNVIGKQWAWDFNYRTGPHVPQDVYEPTVQVPLDGNEMPPHNIPTLYLPVNKTIELVLNSRDVNHSFWVPTFLQKMDLIPAKTNYLTLTPQKEGTYQGKCAELCGAYHSEMLANIAVVSEKEFEEHIKNLAAEGNTGSLDEKYNRNPNLNDTQKKESGR